MILEIYIVGMERDDVDRFIELWGRERPDLDVRPLGIVNRISLLAKHLEARDKRVLSHLELPPWAYEVIVALRRQGEPYQLSPTKLRQTTLLSSGAMTARLDRLEGRGLVKRSLSSEDRRSFVVTLTPAGRELADAAVAARTAEIEAVVDSLSPDEREDLASLLRKLLLSLSPPADRPTRGKRKSGATVRAQGV